MLLGGEVQIPLPSSFFERGFPAPARRDSELPFTPFTEERLTSDNSQSNIPDHEDGLGYDQGLRGDAVDPPRSLPYLQATCPGRGAFRQQAVRCLLRRRLIIATLS
jgi:hypothetical protein